MLTATIFKLRQLRNLGIFADHSHQSGTPAFRRYNLVYGFNGSGKTTLSRVFQSLGTERLSPHLPVGGELTIELSDGTLIKAADLKNGISARIVVFNHDFINDNLIWQSGAAKPVFYIGTAQANTLKLLQILEKRIAPRHQASVAVEKDWRGKDREFASFKTDIGKLVAEELSLGRRYNATNVEADYSAFDPPATKVLSEEVRKAKKALINREAPAQDIVFHRPKTFASTDLVRRALTICSHSLGGVMIEALKQHPSMTGWVKAGLDYHIDRALDECLHCGQPITSERIAALQSSFDTAYEDHVCDIAESRSDIGELVGALRAIGHTLPPRLPAGSPEIA